MLPKIMFASAETPSLFFVIVSLEFKTDFVFIFSQIDEPYGRSLTTLLYIKEILEGTMSCFTFVSSARTLLIHGNSRALTKTLLVHIIKIVLTVNKTYRRNFIL